MRTASGSIHLNNRFKTTPMDRFFFVINILINGQTVYYETYRVPSSTGFKEKQQRRMQNGSYADCLKTCLWRERNYEYP